MEVLKTRVNKIFYQNESEDIIEEIVYDYEKLTMKEAKEYLTERFKRPKLILKVIMEEAEVKLDKELLEENTVIVTKEN